MQTDGETEPNTLIMLEAVVCNVRGGGGVILSVALKLKCERKTNYIVTRKYRTLGLRVWVVPYRKLRHMMNVAMVVSHREQDQ